jgi:hypothetical protein
MGQVGHLTRIRLSRRGALTDGGGSPWSATNVIVVNPPPVRGVRKNPCCFRQSNINEIADILDITEGEQPPIARDRRVL